MTGTPNLFSRFGFQAGAGGKLDNYTRAFFSKFKGRVGPAIPYLDANSSWARIASTANVLIKEFVAQGWVQKGYGADETAFTSVIRAVTMIPAATEWGYAPYEVFQDAVTGFTEYAATQNGYSAYDSSQWVVRYSEAESAGRIGGAACDWATSLNSLQNQLPNCELVNLYAAWYGNDLRAGSCMLVPGVTHDGSGEMPNEWQCNGLSRNQAHIVSSVGCNAAYGGTPDDQSLVAAIEDLKGRGLKVCFTPFILMDIPAGNTLPDPCTGAIGQPVYPWRGRITKSFETADETQQVAAEVAAFVAQYRTFVLHCAQLCADAGGVDAFLLGTELRGLTWLRDAAGSYPFVSALIELAADVKAVLPDAQLTYAADWSEWFGHQPADGSGDVFFHLDPLWADANIAAIAFDNYWPLSDWRDGAPNADETVKSDGTVTAITDYGYLMGNVRGGEGYDWYYASPADREFKRVAPSAMARMGSRGCSATRTSGAGGRTGISTGREASKIRRPHPGCLGRSRSGLPNWAVPLSIRERTSRTFSTIRNPPKALYRIFRTAGRIIRSSGATSIPCCAFSTRTIRSSPRTATREARSMAGAWPISAGS